MKNNLILSIPEPKRKKAMWYNEVWGGGFGPFPPEKDQVKGKFWGCTAWEGPDTDFPDVKNADATIEFLRQDHDKPFFLVYGLWRPHTPFTAPKRFFEMYKPEDILIPIPGWRQDDMDDIPPLGPKLAKVWGDRFDIVGIICIQGPATLSVVERASPTVYLSDPKLDQIISSLPLVVRYRNGPSVT